jgi:hypothetical protein
MTDRFRLTYNSHLKNIKENHSLSGSLPPFPEKEEMSRFSLKPLPTWNGDFISPNRLRRDGDSRSDEWDFSQEGS